LARVRRPRGAFHRPAFPQSIRPSLPPSLLFPHRELEGPQGGREGRDPYAPPHEQDVRVVRRLEAEGSVGTVQHDAREGPGRREGGREGGRKGGENVVMRGEEGRERERKVGLKRRTRREGGREGERGGWNGDGRRREREEGREGGREEGREEGGRRYLGSPESSPFSAKTRNRFDHVPTPEPHAGIEETRNVRSTSMPSLPPPLPPPSPPLRSSPPRPVPAPPSSPLPQSLTKNVKFSPSFLCSLSLCPSSSQ